MISSITIDDRALRAKLRALGAKANTAVWRASNEAATQTRNAAEREIKAVLNLPARKIKQKLPVRRASSRLGRQFAEVRGEYETVGAQSFLGWTYRGRVGRRLVRGNARRSMFANRLTGNLGLKVRFKRTRPHAVFRKAFPYRGSFFQRTGRARYPIVRIVGPSVWGEFVNRFPETVANGRRIFRRRLEYWRDRIASEVNR